MNLLIIILDLFLFCSYLFFAFHKLLRLIILDVLIFRT